MNRPSPIFRGTENTQDTDSPLDRHSRKCQVCRHPERQAIEEQFSHWLRPSNIARLYDLDWRALYRHAHAVGLFDQRRHNMRSIMENILERGAEAPVTADALLRTYRAYTTLGDDGKWVEPAKHVVFSTQRFEAPQPEPQIESVEMNALPAAPNAVEQAAPDTQIPAQEMQLAPQSSPFLIDSPAD
jgi:hypothetical protein